MGMPGIWSDSIFWISEPFLEIQTFRIDPSNIHKVSRAVTDPLFLEAGLLDLYKIYTRPQTAQASLVL